MTIRLVEMARCGGLAITLVVLLAGTTCVGEPPNQEPTACSDGWRRLSTPDTVRRSTLTDVEVLARDDVWAVGSTFLGPVDQPPLVLHWNGRAWQVFRSVGQAGTDAWLDSVAATSSDDVWVAGSVRGRVPLIAHWDGEVWTTQRLKFSSNQGAELLDLQASSPDDVWAVGFYGSSPSGTTVHRPVAFHWNGKGWSRVPMPGRGELRGVDVSGETLAVGGGYPTFSKKSEPPSPFALRWAGNRWLRPALPAAFEEGWLSAVATTGSGGWAVGAVGDAYAPGSTDPLVLRFSEDEWNAVDVDAIQEGRLTGVAAVSEDEFWAVGITPDSEPMAAHWKDGRLEPVSLPALEGSQGTLEAVDAAPSGEVWAVGAQGRGFETGGRYSPLVLLSC